MVMVEVVAAAVVVVAVGQKTDQGPACGAEGEAAPRQKARTERCDQQDRPVGDVRMGPEDREGLEACHTWRRAGQTLERIGRVRQEAVVGQSLLRTGQVGRWTGSVPRAADSRKVSAMKTEML